MIVHLKSIGKFKSLLKIILHWISFQQTLQSNFGIHESKQRKQQNKSMKNRQALFILSLLATLMFFGHASCPLAKQELTKIQTDSICLHSSDKFHSSQSYSPIPDSKSRDQEQNGVFPYKFKQYFNNFPSIAIAVNQIHYQISSSLLYKITTSKITYSEVHFLSDYQLNNAFNQIKISFLATDRKDIQIGQAAVSRPPLSSVDNTFSLSYIMKNDISTKDLKIIHFLHGLNLESANKSNNGLRHVESKVKNSKIIIRLEIVSRQIKIQLICLSIIAFDPQNPSFSFFSGEFTKQAFYRKHSQRLESEQITTLNGSIFGLSSFQLNRKQSLSFSVSINQDFDLTINPLDNNQFETIKISYLLIQFEKCSFCGQYSYLFEGECRRKCPLGYQSKKGRCVQSECTEGYRRNSVGKCQSICQQNQQYIDGQCKCQTDVKKCKQGQYYSKEEKTCILICSQNSKYRNGRCYCNQGYYLIQNSKCQKCKYGSYYDAMTLTCVTKCNKNEIYKNSMCVCDTGYYRINGRCSKCPYSQYYDQEQKQCLCKKDFDLVDGECVDKCDNGEIRVNGVCECPEGQHKVDGICTDCGEHGYYKSDSCKCDTNYEYVNGKCRVVQCPDNSYIQNGKCIERCIEQYQKYNKTTGKCECLDGYDKINGLCQPKCAKNQYKYQGSCRCLQGYTKRFGQFCENYNCSNGKTWDEIRGDCLSTCKTNQAMRGGRCVCPLGFFRNNYGNCLPNCKSNQINRNGFCQCSPGYVRSAYGYCILERGGSKSCLPGMIFIFGECKKPTFCEQNQEWCGTECNCINGYYRKNGKCVRVQPTLLCPENSVSNGVNCMCKPGYFPLIAGICQKCPHQTHWDGYSCVSENRKCQKNYHWDSTKENCYQQKYCRMNQEWDGIRCACKQGYFFIGGYCKQCPYNTVFDGAKCSSGFQAKGKCKDPYSFWNGRTCVCLPGYWPLADGKCISCPDGTQWDGTCCKENNGKRYPRTVY